MRTSVAIITTCIAIAAGTTMSYRLLRPECVSYRNGENHFAEGKYAEAAADYQKAIEKELREPQAYLRLTESQLALGRYSEARETAHLFRVSVKQKPETVYSLSELFVAHGQFDMSIQLLTGLISKNPHNRQTRFRLAQILTWTQQFDEAIRQYHILLGEKL